MKASQFNIFADLDNGNRILFNSVTGAMAELDPNSYSQVSAVLKNPLGESAENNLALRQQLVYGGFLIEDDVHELAQQKMYYNRGRFGKDLLTLAIAPTLDCNLTCDLCYGRQHKMKMRPPVEKFLVSFLDKTIRKAEKIHVTWFGGEPLLEIDTIERIQRHLADKAAGYGIELFASTIITNGALLDKTMALRLNEAGVHTAQVTLNGPREAHDKTRKLSEVNGSFDRIVFNLSQVAGILDTIVRINVAASDVEGMNDVLDSLAQADVLGRVRLLVAPSRVKTEICADAIGRCRQSDSELKNHLNIYRNVTGRSGLKFDFPYLLAEPSCPTDSDSSFIIAPSGYIFKCWQDVSARVDQSVDSIFYRPVDEFQHRNMLQYTTLDPLESNSCKSCAILPVCAGGCAIDIREQTESLSGKCKFFSENLQDLLELRHLYVTRREAT
ncbi:MAG: radical SAM protein [Candidatus Zixiibacteriota bacterium]